MSELRLCHASCVDQNVDAVVNAANSGLWAGGGTCKAVPSCIREVTEAEEEFANYE